MEHNKFQLDKDFVQKAIIVVISALFVMYFSNVLSFFKTLLRITFPIILGLIIAYIVNLILQSLERIFFPNSKSLFVNKIRRPVCIFLSFLIIIASIYLILHLVIPEINDSINIITNGAPKLAEDMRSWFLKATEGVDWASEYRKQIENTQINWSEVVEKLINLIKSSIDGILGSTFTLINSVLGVFLTTITSLIFTINYLGSKEMVNIQLNKLASFYLKKEHVESSKYVLSVLDDKFSSFIRGELIDSIIVGIITFITMTVFRLPYASTISIVIMVTSLIPIVGSYVGVFIGFLMIAVINIKQSLLFILILAIMLQLESSIIYPKIAGKSIGLPSIWVFAAVIVGGSLAGPLGMLVGVPLVASIYTLIKNHIKKNQFNN